MLLRFIFLWQQLHRETFKPQRGTAPEGLQNNTLTKNSFLSSFFLHFQIRMPAPRKHGKGVGGGRPKSADDAGEEEKMDREREMSRLIQAERRGQVWQNNNWIMK